MKSKLIHVFMAAALAGSTMMVQAGVVVVVSAKSAVGNLTVDQVSQIFLGKTSAFPAGGQAIPIDQIGGSPSYTEFYAKVAGKDGAQLKAYWSKLVFAGKGQPPKEVSSSGEVKKLVADNPNLIGYIESEAVDASVKVVLTP